MQVVFQNVKSGMFLAFLYDLVFVAIFMEHTVHVVRHPSCQALNHCEKCTVYNLKHTLKGTRTCGTSSADEITRKWSSASNVVIKQPSS